MVDDDKLHRFMRKCSQTSAVLRTLRREASATALGLYKALHERGPMAVTDPAGAASANLLTIEADLSGDASIDEIVAKARERFGVIDILDQQCRGRSGDDAQRQPTASDQILGGDP